MSVIKGQIFKIQRKAGAEIHLIMQYISLDKKKLYFNF